MNPIPDVELKNFENSLWWVDHSLQNINNGIERKKLKAKSGPSTNIIL